MHAKQVPCVSLNEQTSKEIAKKRKNLFNRFFPADIYIKSLHGKFRLAEYESNRPFTIR